MGPPPTLSHAKGGGQGYQGVWRSRRELGAELSDHRKISS